MNLKYFNINEINARRKNSALKPYEVNLKERNKVGKDGTTGFKGENLGIKMPYLLPNINTFPSKINHT